MSKKISVICPVHNEAANIAPFFERALKVFGSLDTKKYDWELLFTNNCSTDQTLEEILKLRSVHAKVRVITFSRNFGYQCSIFAGLENTSGDLFMIIDVDCEDPPEMLLQFLEVHEQGYDVVYGVREKRQEWFGMHWMRKCFYRLNYFLSDYALQLDMAEFFLINKAVRDALTWNKSNYPFLRAEIGYVGFRKYGIPYTRAARQRGRSHYNFWGNTNFAVAGILSSSTLFLRFSGFFGLPLFILNILFVMLFCISGFNLDRPYMASIYMLFLLDFSFLIYTTLFIALYVARIYKNGLHRPLYFIDETRSAY